MRVFSSSDVLVNKKVVKLPLNWHKAEFLCTSILLVTPSNIFSGGGGSAFESKILLSSHQLVSRNGVQHISLHTFFTL